MICIYESNKFILLRLKFFDTRIWTKLSFWQGFFILPVSLTKTKAPLNGRIFIKFFRTTFVFPWEEKLTGWLMNCHTPWLALRETYEKAVKHSVSDFLSYKKEHWNLVVIQRLLSLGKIKGFRNISNEAENSNCLCPVYSSSFFPWATCLFSFPHVFQELMVTHHFGENETWSLPQVDPDLLLNWLILISNSQFIFWYCCLINMTIYFPYVWCSVNHL